jgi:cytidylate kinase
MLITISRQFGAGGAEVAKRVAEELGWSVIDNEFVDQVAERAGIPREEVARLEERTPSFMERLAHTTAMTFPELFVPPIDPVDDFEEAKLVKITRNLVAELASEGRMVVVGRAAAAVLSEDTDTLHIRLIAGKAFRIKVVAARLAIEPEQALPILEKRDRNRARYHREFYKRDWNDPANYDMVLNTERLGFDGAAQPIVARARALNW